MTNSLVQRYEKARSACALFHLENWAAVQITGPDSRDFLQRLSTQDLRPLQTGAAAQTLFLGADGRLLADCIVICTHSESFLITCPQICADKLLETLDRFHFAENLVIKDLTDSYYIGMIAGPHGEQILHQIKDIALQGEEVVFTATVPMAPASVRQMVLLPLPAFEKMRSALYLALENEGVIGGADLFDTLRIEEGVPVFGRELSEKTIPLESSQKAAISFTKGCFPGQEIVARINNLGHPANVLVGLILPETSDALEKRELLKDGKVIGRITSTCFSPALRSVLGLGYVKWNLREVGQELAISGEDTYTAKVIEVPLPGLVKP